MRIAVDAHAASHPQPGGFKTYTDRIINHVPPLDPENNYLIYLDRSAYKVPSCAYKNVMVRVIEPRIPGIGAALREQFLVPRRLKADGVSLAHFTTNTSPFLMHCPAVLTVHDTISWIEPPPQFRPDLRESTKRWGMYVYNRYASMAAARRAIRVITVSEYSRKEIIDRFGFSPRRVTVTYEAPSEIFHPIPGSSARDSVQARFGLDQPFLLALSSASPRKNIQGLLAAYASLQPEMREAFQLVIVWTHGLWKTHIKDQSIRLGIQGRVVFLDSVQDEDLVQLYNATSLFVFPSLSEGFGLPPLEAMACGTPVVASNLTCLPETLGDAALMVDPRSAEQLAKAMATALSTPALLLELRARGMAWVKRYSWDRCARETIQVYSDASAEMNSPSAS